MTKKNFSATYVCEKCNKNFDCRKRFERHRSKQSDCSINKYILTEKIENSEKKIYKCNVDECDYFSKFQSNTRKHVMKCKRVSEHKKNNPIEKPKRVVNKRKHLEEYVHYVFSDLRPSHNDELYIDFIFDICMNNRITGLATLAKTILFNRTYHENINKHLVDKKDKKMFIYRGNTDTDVISLEGKQTDILIKEIIKQLLKIVKKMKLILFKDKDKQEEYKDKYKMFKIHTYPNNSELQEALYKMFEKNKKRSQKFFDTYNHLLKINVKTN